MSNFCHLHMHSNHSILDSVSKVPDIVKRLKEYGHSHAFLTEHGTISSAVEFYNECKKVGIQSQPSCEFYMMPDCAEDRQAIADGTKKAGKRNYHLILLAMDDEGWQNIKILNTKANEKFYYDPRIDYKDLREHSNGIIALTACLKGIVPYNLSIDEYDEASKHAQELKNIFGDRFYLEVQDGGLDIQIKVNQAMRLLGQRLEIPIVAAQDAHYIDRNDVIAHEAIWAIRTQETLDKPVGDPKTGGRIYYSTREYWLKDLNHILFDELTTDNGHTRMTTLTQEELERTMEIADRCKPVNIEKKMHLPRYEFIPDIDLRGCAIAIEGCNDKDHEHNIDTSFNYLVQLVTEGYEEKYGVKYYEAPQEHKDRLRKELGDIKLATLADYFLIVWDIVKWAREQGIPTGPGRGSAAGSMVAYCLSITKVDPLKYGLIWERFYNVGRKGSLADIDLDFCKRRREEVFNYIKQRFGENRVAQMVTFNTLATKAALKDTAKLLGSQGMEFEDANAMTKHVPFKSKNLSDALENSDKLREYEAKFPKLFQIAKVLEDCPKSKGKHAAGIVISDEDFSTGTLSLCWDTKKKQLVTEWDGETLEKLGYLKIDALSLKTLTVLNDIEKDVNKELNND